MKKMIENEQEWIIFRLRRDLMKGIFMGDRSRMGSRGVMINLANSIIGLTTENEE